jgi:hypothetical protein
MGPGRCFEFKDDIPLLSGGGQNHDGQEKLVQLAFSIICWRKIKKTKVIDG